MPHSAGRLVAETRQMAFSGQRPQMGTVDDLCAKRDQLVGEIRLYPAISDGRSRQGRRDRPRGNRYVLNFLYSQRRPSWRRQTCPRTSRPVIVRRGMMTVHKCQALVIAGRWINPRVRRMAIIVPFLVGSIDPLQVRAVQNVLMPLVGFHDGSPSGDDESDK